MRSGGAHRRGAQQGPRPVGARRGGTRSAGRGRHRGGGAGGGGGLRGPRAGDPGAVHGRCRDRRGVDGGTRRLGGAVAGVRLVRLVRVVRGAGRRLLPLCARRAGIQVRPSGGTSMSPGATSVPSPRPGRDNSRSAHLRLVEGGVGRLRIPTPRTGHRGLVSTRTAVLGIVLALCGIGLVMVLSASAYTSLQYYGSVWTIFERQILWMGLGAIAFFGAI